MLADRLNYKVAIFLKELKMFLELRIVEGYNSENCELLNDYLQIFFRNQCQNLNFLNFT